MLFQKRSPVVQILYYSLCDILKRQAIESKYGSDLASVECRNVKLQLADKEIIMGESTFKSIKGFNSRSTEKSLAWNAIILWNHNLRILSKIASR